jgi:hypothetical protein
MISPGSEMAFGSGKRVIGLAGVSVALGTAAVGVAV